MPAERQSPASFRGQNHLSSISAVLNFAGFPPSHALASDAIDVGGSHVVDINGGSGVRTSPGLLVVGSLVILGGTVAAVVSWIGALLNTWQLEDKLWFASLLAAGVLGFGVVAMIAYLVAGPDGANQSAARPGIAGAAPV